MKKKIILLIGFIFMLCGCTANVDINITHDGIEEKVSIVSLEDGVYTKEEIKSGFRKNVPVFYDVIIADTEPDIPKNGVTYYTMTQQDLGTGYNTTYKYTFPLKQYNKSTALKSAFKSAEVTGYPKPVSSKLPEEKRTIKIATDATGLKVFNTYNGLESVNVNIRTDYEVLDSNADSIKDGVYTWTFTSETRKSIYIVLDNSIDDGDEQEPGENESKKDKKKTFYDEHPVLTALIAIGAFLIVAIILSKMKIKG